MGVLAWLKSQFILQLLIGFVFVVSGLIINFIQLCTCVLWPINKQLYRRINTRMSYSLWSRKGLSVMGVLAWLKSQFILQLLIGFVFVVSGLIINFIQLCTCVLWPINKQLYRRINTRMSYSLWSQLVMLLEWWSGTECMLYTDQATVDHFGKEHAIIILNHNYEIDFLCGWTMCERYGVLGSSKVLAKRELLKVPLIGWTWYFLEIVFCKRKWEEDRETVFKGLKQLMDYPEYMWFLLYCEGTRFTEKKHQISMQVAESKGLPKLKYHLLPRTKGFTTTLQCLKGTVKAVYDVTLNFKDKENPTLLGIINGKKYRADMRVRRFPVEEIPHDEKECADWLHKLYQEKDELQEFYFKEEPSIAVRRLIGVTEVKKTGSSYGNAESKKEN
ncbi:hypothetical protein PGIGA_G00161100 [Pangasianodon gigas]|uniref:Uncharacterized protein n=1 Tax=Pangasianodon gigas TaxID=30993 RepID=A0ACC5XT47_PANGG|nr:hypothetical protein [Pangasianodon gigas]